MTENKTQKLREYHGVFYNPKEYLPWIHLSNRKYSTLFSLLENESISVVTDEDIVEMLDLRNNPYTPSIEERLINSMEQAVEIQKERDMPTKKLRTILGISYHPDRPYYPWRYEDKGSYTYPTLTHILFNHAIMLADSDLKDIMDLENDPYEKQERLINSMEQAVEIKENGDMPKHKLKVKRGVSFNPNRPHYPWLWSPSSDAYPNLSILLIHENVTLPDTELREVLALPDDPYEKCETLMGVVLELLSEDGAYDLNSYLDRIRAAVLAEEKNGQPVD